MRIALNAGGLGGMTISGFQSDAASLTSKIDGLIVTFVAVKNKTCNLNGGVGRLGGALDSVQARINTETARKDAAVAAQTKVNSFLALAIRVDNQVAAVVLKNKEEFYTVNPWLKPASDKPWYENAWNDFCGFCDDVGSFLEGAWNGLMEWCSSNIGKIVLGVLAVVGAVLLVVLIVSTGGMALAPLLMAWGLSAGVAAGISMTVAGIALVSTAIAFIPNTFDLIAAVDEVIDPEHNAFSDWNNSLHQMDWYNKVQGVANITSAVAGGMYSIGSAYNASKGITNADLKNIKNLANGPKTYTPINQGPLPNDVANTFRSGTYNEVLAQGDTTLYRVYGGKAGEIGSYWTTTPPQGPVQSMIDSALLPEWGNTATNVSTIRVPPGKTIFQGFAAPQGGLVGGGPQVYIPKVSTSWLIK